MANNDSKETPSETKNMLISRGTSQSYKENPFSSSNCERTKRRKKNGNVVQVNHMNVVDTSERFSITIEENYIFTCLLHNLALIN